MLTPFLRTLVERGLDASQGLLVILDGGTGRRSAVTQVFRGRALVQRCQWHKRENVVSYLSTSEQADWRRRLQRAYTRPTYDEALPALDQLYSELEDRNQSAARSLAEGLEETQRWSPKFGQVVKVESRSDRRNLECHERDEATRLS